MSKSKKPAAKSGGASKLFALWPFLIPVLFALATPFILKFLNTPTVPEPPTEKKTPLAAKMKSRRAEDAAEKGMAAAASSSSTPKTTDNVASGAAATTRTAAERQQPTTATAATTDDPSCVDAPDVAASCKAWADMGECDKNPIYMTRHCRKSCGCPRPAGEVTAIQGMEEHGGAAQLAAAQAAQAAAARGAAAKDPACVDRDTSGACAAWSAAGECEKNPSYMKLKCASTCNTCDFLDYKKRCPIDPDRSPAVAPNAMSETFQAALRDFPELGPTIISEEPWVMSFENFLSAEEIEAILKHGDGRFERSTASGGRKDDEFIPIKSEIRTSWTTWCDNQTCLDDPVIQKVYERVSSVTRVPGDNFEYMQLLRYLPCEHPTHPDCQFYKRHHDTIPELAKMQPGPRVYTFFLYLSDVEEGGGTRFDGQIGTVHPKAGKALFWPATKEAEPFVSDPRTHHEALPVTKGTKYAANFWLHQYDYVTPHKNGCTT